MENETLAKLLLLGGFLFFSFVGLYLLAFFLLALVYAKEGGVTGAVLIYGVGFFVSSVMAVVCYVLPEKLWPFE